MSQMLILSETRAGQSQFSLQQDIKLSTSIKFEKQKQNTTQSNKQDLNNINTQFSQIQQFVALYDVYNSKWNKIFKHIIGKFFFRSSVHVKNFFYNRLRNLAYRLEICQRKQKIVQRRQIDYCTLHNIIDQANFIKKYVQSTAHEFLLFKVKEDIISCSLIKEETQDQKLRQLAKNIRKIRGRHKNLNFDRKRLSNSSFASNLAQKILAKELKNVQNCEQNFEKKTDSDFCGPIYKDLLKIDNIESLLSIDLKTITFQQKSTQPPNKLISQYNLILGFEQEISLMIF